MTTHHMCISVRGMLRWNRREAIKNLKHITRKDGRRFASVEEFRSMLMDELANGHEVLPTCECDNFDFKIGCRGHPAKESSAVALAEKQEVPDATK